jgi:hypothetical protein
LCRAALARRISAHKQNHPQEAFVVNMELQPFACARTGCVARPASTLLTFDAVVKAVDEIEAKRKQAAE